MTYYSDADYATLLAELRQLPRKRLVILNDVELQPYQLRELDALKGFVLIAARENQNRGNFYCIAHREDKDLAVARIMAALRKSGARNVGYSLLS